VIFCTFVSYPRSSTIITNPEADRVFGRPAKKWRVLRIVQVTHTFLPRHIGGRETHVYKLSKSLQRRGHEVTVLTGGSKQQVEDYKGIRVIRCPTLPILLSNYPTRLVYRLVPDIFFRLVKEKADVVHAHDYAHFTTDAAAIACRIAKKPLVVTVHGFLPVTRPTRALMRIYDRLVGGFSLRTAETIIAVSKTQASGLLQRGVIPSSDQDKIKIIPNGIDFNDITPAPSKCLFRQRYSIGENDKLVLAVGRLIKRKGFSRLIEIADSLLEKEGSLKIAIVGPDGGYQDKLRKMTSSFGLDDSILFTGAVPETTLMNAYMDADLVVVPSEYEGLPTTLLEALAYGKPVVATNVGGNGEVIENYRDGILVNPNNEELSNGILTVLADRTLSQEMGRNGRTKAQLYDWDKITDRVLTAYENSIESHQLKFTASALA
jgi:glycogen(starch) synthase